MDIAREGIAEGRRRRRIVLMALGGGGLAALVFFALRLAPAAPSVDRGTVFVDTVRRGEMLLSVRGPGTLVPVEVRRVAAGSSGRVAAVHALPGSGSSPRRRSSRSRTPASSRRRRRRSSNSRPPKRTSTTGASGCAARC